LEVLTKLRERVRRKGRNCGRRNHGFCSKTMRQLTTSSRWSNFLSISAFQCSNTPLFTGFSPLWLLTVPQNEKCVVRNSFSVCRWGEMKNGGPAEQAVIWWPAALLWTMENLYAAVYR
jgi:hypothetical protein